jgi:3-methyladenine DNA glycosylase AlkD
MYFKFEANPELVAKIVSAQGLHLVAGPSPEARQIEEMVKREVDWWQLADTTAQDKVYWVRYDAKRPELETAFRLLVVKAKHAYFVTSGYFVPENYDQGKS